eukprot:TRINITY_DN14546_c0_g1_i1.p1 TRINITY_DN14546_c0_g1~~TRINITY_DN14546_c0_g1_i1.p1  ORF type:complete len:600 (+),score=178.38 TRINITY_DN14546_c0_g1_i1:50-1849(+)
MSASNPSVNEDDPKEILNNKYDQATVARLAMQMGKETWSGMSWGERLAAVEKYAPPSEGSVAATPKAASVASPAMPQSVISNPPSNPVPAAATPVPGTPASRPRSESKASLAASIRSARPTTPIRPPSTVGKPPTAPSTPIPEAATPAIPVESPLLSKRASFSNSVHEGVSRHSSVLSARQAPSTPQRPATPITPPQAQSPVAYSPVPQSPGTLPCTACDGHIKRIRSLEAELHEAKGAVTVWKARAAKKAAKAAPGGEMNSTVLDALNNENTGLKRRLQEAETEKAALARQVDEARAEAHSKAMDLEAVKEELRNMEDPEMLRSQLWTLEKALLLRNDEIANLNNVMHEFLQRIAVLDEQLASALQQLLTQTKDEAAAEEREMFNGATVEEAVGEAKKKSKRKRSISSRRGSRVAEAELLQLKHENEMLKHKIQLQQKVENKHQAGDATLLREKDMVIAGLQDQLQKAQDAIISGVESGVEMRKESELKLKETRGVLKILLKKQEEAVPVPVAAAPAVPAALVSMPSTRHSQVAQAEIVHEDPQSLPVWSVPPQPLPVQHFSHVPSPSHPRPAMTVPPHGIRSLSPVRPPTNVTPRIY